MKPFGTPSIPLIGALLVTPDNRVDDAGCRFSVPEALQLVEGDGSIHEVGLIVFYRLSRLPRQSMLVGAEFGHACHLVICRADPAFSTFYRSLE